MFGHLSLAVEAPLTEAHPGGSVVGVVDALARRFLPEGTEETVKPEKASLLGFLTKKK